MTGKRENTDRAGAACSCTADTPGRNDVLLTRPIDTIVKAKSPDLSVLATQALRCFFKATVAGVVFTCAVTAVAGEGEDDVISPGDFVFVDVYRREELSTTAQVDSAGNIDLPYVGKVEIGGLTESQAGAAVCSALREILKNPRVTVSRTLGYKTDGARTAEMETQVINLTNAQAESMFDALKGMSSQGGSLGFDPYTNTLIITDTPGVVQNMMSVIGQLDRMRSQLTQVRIEAKIAEVDEGAMKDLGVRWFVKGNEVTGGFYPPAAQDPRVNAMRGGQGGIANEMVRGIGGGINRGFDREFVEEPNFDRRIAVPVHVPTPGQLFFGLLNDNVDIGTLLDALVEDNKAEMLANPMILAVNHRPAEIKMTDEYPYTEYTLQAYGAHQSTKFMDLGIKLEVTPHVYRDEKGIYIQLELVPEVSWYSGSSNGVPIRSVRTSDTVTNVRDRQTLVIGGIVMDDERNVEQRVPGLGRLPVIGNLFKHQERAKSRKELMVFVTPTVHSKPETITWDKMLNLSVAEEQHAGIPSRPNGRESRRD